MQAYLDLVRMVLDTGSWQENRTGIRTLSVPGAAMRFDLAEGFPAVTTRKLPFKSAIGELVGFLRGTRSAADFRALGCKVWDQNANENQAWLDNPYRGGPDDLGDIYGVQWRAWPAYKRVARDARAQLDDALGKGFQVVAETADSLVLYKAIDQLRQCVETIHARPGDRRILFHAWNPAELDQMALPPCHLLYQFLPNAQRRELSLCLYVRSNDIGLGAPFNLCEAAALLHLIGRLTGYRPRWFSYFIGDAHLYENQLDMVRTQLDRAPLPAPTLRIADRIPDFNETGVFAPEWLEKVEPADFVLEGYQHHPPLTAPMAV
ncbi:thymidylate synthase [Chitinasiproducens palmae]|uniref:Thymidylate synthase n=1 Tax=Chitinasiproducens palmae TaxID=1770053 RepID=A0A1H2PUP1_9BURK|nr:thymidylate synthase [Chitinasiproducens palmae]SDV50911.1 thymidylate synthase [Chitinasiproducens palmae]